MQASTVEVLVKKGGFDPQIALAIAQAMDMTVVDAQLVTVPVLDGRLEAIRSEIRELRSETNFRFEAMQKRMDDCFLAMDKRMDERFLVMSKRMDERFVAVDKRMDERFEAMDKKMDERFLAVDRKMDERFAFVDKTMDERFEAAEKKADGRFLAAEARTDEKLQRMKTELIFWICGATVGSAFLPRLVSALAQLAQR